MKSNLYWFCFLIGFLWFLLGWSLSPGPTFDDEMGHIVISDQAWRDPSLALNIWGRVVRSVYYMPFALFGVNGARLGSVILTAASCILATLIAARLGEKRLYFIPLAFWFQPWIFNLGYWVIPQVPLMALMALAILLSLDKRYGAAALAFGLMPLTRHETISLVLLFALVMVIQKNLKAVLIAALPFLAYNLIYGLALGDPLPIAQYLQPSGADFGRGHILHFLPGLVLDIGLPLFVLATLGLYRIKFGWLIIYPAYFLTHTLIYALGSYSSGGYTLFLLPMAVLFAVLAARGLSLSPSRVFAWGLTALFVVFALGFMRPRPVNSVQAAALQAADYIQSRGESTISFHPWIVYYGGLEIGRELWLAQPNDQKLIAWDSLYAPTPDPEWELIQDFGEVRIYDTTPALPNFSQQPPYHG